MGGEYNGVVAYLLEGAAARKRGFITSFAAAASEVGALFAAGVAALTANAMSTESLDSWGWRIPFFFGAIIAGSIWFARSTMQESPEFEDYKTRGATAKNPLGLVLREHRVGVLRCFAMSALGSITYYVGITYVPAYVTSLGVFSERDSLSFSTLPAIAVILVNPFIGALSDRVGRKPVLLALGVCGVVLPITMFALMAGGSYLQAVFGAVVLAAVAGGVSAVAAAATAEQFPGNGRLSGLAVGATVGTAIFGGLTPYAAQYLVKNTGSQLAPGILIAVVSLSVLPVLFLMKETRPAP